MLLRRHREQKQVKPQVVEKQPVETPVKEEKKPVKRSRK